MFTPGVSRHEVNENAIGTTKARLTRRKKRNAHESPSCILMNSYWSIFVAVAYCASNTSLSLSLSLSPSLSGPSSHVLVLILLGEGCIECPISKTKLKKVICLKGFPYCPVEKKQKHMFMWCVNRRSAIGLTPCFLDSTTLLSFFRSMQHIIWFHV